MLSWMPAAWAASMTCCADADQASRERRLAGTRRPHDRENLPGPDVEVEAIENMAVAGAKPHTELLEHDVALDCTGFY